VDNEQLVQLVTAEVMRQLAKMPTALPPQAVKHRSLQAVAIFTGGTIGCEQSLAELQKLQDLNFRLTVVLSPTAESIVGSDKIKGNLGRDIDIITTQSPYPGKVLREAAIVLVPVLTQNTAAKLAHSLADTLATTLIMQALMMGKPVVAALNAADPADSWRAKADMGKSPPGLAQALRGNLRKMESYGIQLVQVEQLAAHSQKILDSNVNKPVSGEQTKKKVIDAETIKAAVSNGDKSITASRTMIVTPLARDVAREYGIEIVRDS
jgi:hypothetical protein